MWLGGIKKVDLIQLKSTAANRKHAKLFRDGEPLQRVIADGPREMEVSFLDLVLAIAKSRVGASSNPFAPLLEAVGAAFSFAPLVDKSDDFYVSPDLGRVLRDNWSTTLVGDLGEGLGFLALQEIGCQEVVRMETVVSSSAKSADAFVGVAPDGKPAVAEMKATLGSDDPSDSRNARRHIAEGYEQTKASRTALRTSQPPKAVASEWVSCSVLQQAGAVKKTTVLLCDPESDEDESLLFETMTRIRERNYIDWLDALGVQRPVLARGQLEVISLEDEGVSWTFPVPLGSWNRLLLMQREPSDVPCQNDLVLTAVPPILFGLERGRLKRLLAQGPRAAQSFSDVLPLQRSGVRSSRGVSFLNDGTCAARMCSLGKLHREIL